MKSQRLKFENPQENHYMTVMYFYSIFEKTRKSETLTFPYSGAGRIFKRYAASTLFTKMSLPTAMLRYIVWVVDTWPAEAGTSCPVSTVASCCLHKAKEAKQTQCFVKMSSHVKPGRQEGVENQIFLGLVANEIEPAPRSKGQWWSMLRSVTLPPDSSHVENGALHSYHHFYGRKGKPVNPSANQSLAHMYFNPPIVEVKTWRQCCDSLPVTRGSSNFKTTGLCSIRPCQR